MQTVCISTKKAEFRRSVRVHKMVSGLIPPEIIPLVWFSCIAVTVYVFFRVFSSTLKEKFRQTNLNRKKTESSGQMDAQIDDLIKNAPRILDEVNKDINAQRAKGVSDDQMKGLLQKKQMLELGTSIPPEFYQIVGKPIVKKVISWMGKF